jgi:hypothetical protein
MLFSGMHLSGIGRAGISPLFSGIGHNSTGWQFMGMGAALVSDSPLVSEHLGLFGGFHGQGTAAISCCFISMGSAPGSADFAGPDPRGISGRITVPGLADISSPMAYSQPAEPVPVI